MGIDYLLMLIEALIVHKSVLSILRSYWNVYDAVYEPFQSDKGEMGEWRRVEG